MSKIKAPKEWMDANGYEEDYNLNPETQSYSILTSEMLKAYREYVIKLLTEKIEVKLNNVKPGTQFNAGEISGLIKALEIIKSRI